MHRVTSELLPDAELGHNTPSNAFDPLCHVPCIPVCRVTVVLLPDAELGQRMEGEEKARIEAFRKTLDEKQVGGLGREVRRGRQVANEKRVSCSKRQRMQGRG